MSIILVFLVGERCCRKVVGTALGLPGLVGCKTIVVIAMIVDPTVVDC